MNELAIPTASLPATVPSSNEKPLSSPMVAILTCTWTTYLVALILPGVGDRGMDRFVIDMLRNAAGRTGSVSDMVAGMFLFFPNIAMLLSLFLLGGARGRKAFVNLLGVLTMLAVPLAMASGEILKVVFGGSGDGSMPAGAPAFHDGFYLWVLSFIPLAAAVWAMQRSLRTSK